MILNSGSLFFFFDICIDKLAVLDKFFLEHQTMHCEINLDALHAFLSVSKTNRLVAISTVSGVLALY